MKAYIFSEFGLDNLTLVERETPEVGPTDVRIEIRATALNYRDLLMLKGLYNPRQNLPLVPLSDGVGVVTAVGEQVTTVKRGDRVAGLFCQSWISGHPDKGHLRQTLGGPLDGMLTEQIVLPESGVVPVPDYLSDEAAATLPCAALTAWNAMVSEGGLSAGQTVLVQGTGGVSIFALQIAKALGAKVICTSSSDEKLSTARDLGADELINYRNTPDWGKAVKVLTGKVGVDLVVEVGGSGTLSESIKAVKAGGFIAMIGVLSGAGTGPSLTPVLMNYIRIQGILVGSRERFEAMCTFFEQHRIQPVIDRVFPLSEAIEAFHYLESAQHLGKVCISFPSQG
jgi:NADPH:quinone reductase-like Zn-dependent oxidoreductase